MRVQEALHWWHGPSALLYSALLLVILLVVACQSVRLSVWDAVWGRARVVLGVSWVCVSGACSRGSSSSSSSSSSTTSCVLQLLFGLEVLHGWMGGWVRSGVVMSESRDISCCLAGDPLFSADGAAAEMRRRRRRVRMVVDLS